MCFLTSIIQIMSSCLTCLYFRIISLEGRMVSLLTVLLQDWRFSNVREPHLYNRSRVHRYSWDHICITPWDLGKEGSRCMHKVRDVTVYCAAWWKVVQRPYSAMSGRSRFKSQFLKLITWLQLESYFSLESHFCHLKNGVL